MRISTYQFGRLVGLVFCLLLPAVLILAPVAVALAQTGPAPAPEPATVSFAGVWNAYVWPALGSILSVAVFVAINWLRVKTGLDKVVTEDQLRGVLSLALPRALAVGKDLADRKIVPRLKFSTTNPLVANGAQYLIDSFPDTMRKMKLGPEDVARYVEAELARLTAPAPAGV